MSEFCKSKKLSYGGLKFLSYHFEIISQLLWLPPYSDFQEKAKFTPPPYSTFFYNIHILFFCDEPSFQKQCYQYWKFLIHVILTSNETSAETSLQVHNTCEDKQKMSSKKFAYCVNWRSCNLCFCPWNKWSLRNAWKSSEAFHQFYYFYFRRIRNLGKWLDYHAHHIFPPHLSI